MNDALSKTLAGTPEGFGSCGAEDPEFGYGASTSYVMGGGLTPSWCGGRVAIRLLLLLGLMAQSAEAAWVLLSSTLFSHPTQTSPAINTSGAGLLYACSTTYISGGSGIIDSYGNTWTPVSVRGGSSAVLKCFYVSGPIAGPNHTVTITGDNYSATVFAAFSGGVATGDPADGSTGAGSAGASSLSPGSITPSTGSDLFITTAGLMSNGTWTTSASGFVQIANIAYAPGSHGGTSMYYKVKSDSTAENPGWTGTASSDIAVNLQAFTESVKTTKPVISSFNCTSPVSEGSTTSCTYTTANANSVVVSGACPWSFAGCRYTGPSPASFTPEWSTTFTLTATNAGGTTQQTVNVIVNRPGAPSANPILSNVSASANSDTTILFKVTSDTPAQASAQCGTAAGPSGTVVSMPTIFPLANGPAPHGYGIMNFAFAVTGLSPSTLYHCYATITNAHGATTTSDQQVTTSTAVGSTPLSVAWVSPPTRINDQYNGAHGLPNTGQWIDGDTQYHTWADDGVMYGLYQDGLGVNGAAVPGLGFVSWDANHLTPKQLQALSAGYGLAGNPFSEQGPLSARGIQYLFTINGYGSAACCYNAIQSRDHWQTSISPQHNNGPAAAAAVGIDAPAVRSATISFSSWQSGTITLTVSAWSAPPANTMVYVTGSTNCDGYKTATSADSTHVAFASANVSCAAGTVQYMASMNSPIAIPGDSSVYWLLSPVQPCQDYSANCSWAANMDGWVYFFAHYRGLVRVRVEDLALQDVTKYQCYAGSQNGDDGLYDANWAAATLGPCKALSAPPGMDDPYLYMASSGNKGHIAYVPDFNRFILSMYIGANNCAQASAIFDLGPYPWGKPVLIGSINRDLRFPGLCPGFPNPLLSTYQKISSNPLVSTMVWVTSGGSFKGARTDGSSDNYSPYLWSLRLVPRTATANRAMASKTKSGGRHNSNGLQLFYNFQDTTGTLQIVNRSPNDPTGSFSTINENSSPPIFDRYGLALTVPSGSPDNTTDGISWTGQQQNLTLPTPFSMPLNSYTAFVCFGHYPYQFSGTTINNGQAGEQVLAKSGGDLGIVRHGATFGAGASWDVTVHGTVVGAVAIPDGSFGCVAVRVNGASASVYQSGAVTNSLPLTPTAGPTTVGASGAAGALVLGGTTSLWGILSELLVYDRALSDVELIQEMSVIRKEMAQRWITIDSVSLN